MATPELDDATSDDEHGSLQKLSVGRQALRREVNERIAVLNEGWGSDHFDVFCECGRARCADRLTVSAVTYEELRRIPTHFLVKTEHCERADRLVREYDAFVVVEKFGSSGIEAIALQRGNGKSA